jgi:hypothetical protein
LTEAMGALLGGMVWDFAPWPAGRQGLKVQGMIPRRRRHPEPLGWAP